MKKRLISIAIVVLLFLILLFFPSKKLSTEEMNNLIVKSSILYADSLLKTDALSQQANSDYEEGIIYINKLTKQREIVYKLTKELETQADKLANVSRGQVAAYDAQEITSIIDKAPPGKKIKTLAKELNISAEKAFKLLKMSQQQLTAEARNQAGDTFETLENTTRLIQDGCKVGLMIGGAQLAGTTRAAATALEKASLIINGADLVLQIGEDVSNIALGYNNEVAAVFGDIRKITEPSAAIVGFAGLYDAGGKISSTIDAFTYTFEQTNNIIQDNKVLGIKFKKETLEIDTLQEEEVNNRLQQNNIPTQTDTIKLMENITQLVEIIKEDEKKEIIEKENNLQTKDETETKIEEKKENQESIIGQRTYTEGSITSTYTFTENELSISATSNGERLGNTVTTNYKYENGKGYRGDPSTIAYIKFEIKNDVLHVTNVYDKTQKYTKKGSQELIEDEIYEEKDFVGAWYGRNMITNMEFNYPYTLLENGKAIMKYTAGDGSIVSIDYTRKIENEKIILYNNDMGTSYYKIQDKDTFLREKTIHPGNKTSLPNKDGLAGIKFTKK